MDEKWRTRSWNGNARREKLHCSGSIALMLIICLCCTCVLLNELAGVIPWEWHTLDSNADVSRDRRDRIEKVWTRIWVYRWMQKLEWGFRIEGSGSHPYTHLCNSMFFRSVFEATKMKMRIYFLPFNAASFGIYTSHWKCSIEYSTHFQNSVCKPSIESPAGSGRFGIVLNFQPTFSSVQS